MNLLKSKKIIIPTVLVLIVLALVSKRVLDMEKTESQEDKTPPTVETSLLKDFQEKNSYINSVGKVETLQEVNLKSQLSSEVKNLNIKIGDKVAQGDILIELDHASLDAELSKANATIERLQSNLTQQKTGATQEQIDQAQAGVEQAQAGVEQAKASLEQTKANNEAMIKNAEIGLELAKNSLENTATSSQQTLKNAYESLKLTAANTLSTIRTALTTNGDILGESPGSEKANDLYENYLGVKKTGSLGESEQSFLRARKDYQTALNFHNNLENEITQSQGEELEALVSQALSSTDQSLKSVRITLDNSVTNNSFPQTSVSGTSLDGLKQAVDTQISYINQAQQNLQLQKQTVTNAQISGQGNTEQNQLNYQQAQQNLKDARQQAEANLKTAQKSVETQEKALAKAQSAYEEITAPPRDIDLASTRASIKEAQAGRDLVLDRLGKAYIKAPFSGEIGSVSVTENDYVNVGDPLVSLVNKGGLQVTSYLNSKDIKLITEGATATIEKDISGVVSQISPQVDPQTKKIEVITAITTEGSQLVTGEYVDIKFQISKQNKENTYYLPFKAVKVTPEGNFIFTVNQDNKIEAREVELGRVVNSLNEIKNGLEPDMEIVLSVRGLEEGQIINTEENK